MSDARDEMPGAAAGLVREREVWRVEAADGREGSRGVYDLTHELAGDNWRLRAVLD